MSGDVCVCVMDIDFTSFYDFSIGFWICFNSAVICLLFILITRSNQDLDNKYSSKNTG